MSRAIPNPLVLGALALTLFACATEPPGPLPPASVREVLGTSVDGRPVEAFRYGPDEPGGILVIASIHGSEPAGTALLRELARELDMRPDLWADTPIVLVPVANPDGFRRRERNNTRGVDLNRNFPAANFERAASSGHAPLSEPESRALHGWITSHRPRLVISIHQPLSCIDWDGPAEDLAQLAAEFSFLPVKKLGGRPGSLGSWVGETLGIAILTLELRGGDEVLTSGAAWAQYGEALLVLVGADPAEFRDAD